MPSSISAIVAPKSLCVDGTTTIDPVGFMHLVKKETVTADGYFVAITELDC